jgi:hypothetical protein
MLKLFLAILVFGVLIMISKIISGSIKKKIISNSISDDDYSVKIGSLI